jgi:Mn-dependent DtxR family transcriptional regulator
MEETKTSWCLIPPEIWEDKNLTLNEKCLLGRINALKTEKGYCYAGNGYLAEQLGKSTDRISKTISKLVKEGYVGREVSRDSNNQITERRLYLWLKTTIPMVENNYTPIGENNQVREEYIEESIDQQGINHLMNLFKEVNPSYKTLFGNNTQRGALKRLVGEHTEEKIEELIKSLPEIVTRPYAPKITTPLQLEQKLGELLIFISQEKGKKRGGFVDARTK